MTQPKSLIIKLSAAFLGVLLFLTFFSNTIFTLNLPGVVVGFPTGGVVTSTHRGFGEIEFAEISILFAEDAGRINFAVAVGDMISYGDVLFTIEADRRELLDRLEDAASQMAAAEVNLARAQNDLSFEQARLVSLTPDTIRPTIIHAPDTTRFTFEAQRLEAEIDRAEQDYQTNTALFAAGGISRAQLEDSAHALNQLRESYARNTEEMNIVLEAHAQAVADAQDADRNAQDRNQQVHMAERNAIQHRIETLGHTIRLLELEELDMRRQLVRIHGQIADEGIVTVYAAADGIVREIPAGLESGMMVERNHIVMHLAITHGGHFTVTAEFTEHMGVLPNDIRVRINIRSLEEFGIPGEVRRVSASGGRLHVEIAFEGGHRRINGGERAEVVIEQFSEMADSVLPNSAMRRDGAGYYIMYVAREPNTLLGHSYYARQMRITVLEEGDRFTSFMTMDDLEGPVIIFSDRPFFQNDRIRVVDDE